MSSPGADVPLAAPPEPRYDGSIGFYCIGGALMAGSRNSGVLDKFTLNIGRLSPSSSNLATIVLLVAVAGGVAVLKMDASDAPGPSGPVSASGVHSLKVGEGAYAEYNREVENRGMKIVDSHGLRNGVNPEGQVRDFYRKVTADNRVPADPVKNPIVDPLTNSTRHDLVMKGVKMAETAIRGPMNDRSKGISLEAAVGMAAAIAGSRDCTATTGSPDQACLNEKEKYYAAQIRARLNK